MAAGCILLKASPNAGQRSHVKDKTGGNSRHSLAHGQKPLNLVHSNCERIHTSSLNCTAAVTGDDHG